MNSLLISSIACIAIDEFNIDLGAFTGKATLFLAFLSILKLESGKGFWNPLFVFSMLAFAFGQCISMLNVSIGISPTGGAGNPGEYHASLANLANFMIMIVWAYIFSRKLTLNDVVIAVGLFLSLMLAKSIYIAHLFFSGQIEKIWWFPTGFPRFALKIGGMTANQTGAIWLVLLITLSVLVFEFGAIKKKLFISLILPVVLFFGFMSGSRSFVVGGLVLYVGLMLTIKRLLMLIPFAALSTFAGQAFVDAGFARTDDDSTLSRLDYWKSSFSNFIESPLFGSGWGSDPAPHNTVLQILSQSGLFGMCAFIVIVYSLFRCKTGINSRIVLLMLLPYSFFLAVDIGIMQWQTWALIGVTFVLATTPIIRVEESQNVG